MVKNVYWTDVLFPTNIVDLSIVGPEGVIIPSGSTGQRPLVPTNGTLRYNVTLSETELYQNGSWQPITTSGTTGYTTATNIGPGQSVLVTPAVIPNLQFKTLVAGTNVNFNVSPTDITINAPSIGEVNTAGNIGAGVGVYDSKSGITLNFRSIATTTPGQIGISSSGGGEILIDFVGTIGEANTAVNLGSSAQVFENKVGTTLRFRSIGSAGAPIVVTQHPTEVLISMSSNPVIPGSASMTIPAGPSGSEPSPVNGMIRYNNTNHQLKAVINGSWQVVSTAVGTYLPLGGGSMTGNLAMTGGSDITLGAGSDITFGGGSLIMNSGSGINMTSGGNITMAPSATVDGRDLSIDGAVVDQINGAGTGVVVRTGTSTFTRRTITGTANQITITDGTGVSGNPTIAIASNPIIPGTGSITIPSGTTAQRPGSPANGMTRLNLDNGNPEFYFGGAWRSFLTGTGGTIIGNITLTGANIVMSGTETVDGRDLSLDGVVIDQINAISNNTGVLVRSGGIITSRLISPSVSSQFAGISVVNGNGSGLISIGLDINGLSSTTGLSSGDFISVYDLSSSANVKASMNDIAAYIGTTGFDAQYLNTIGDEQNGNITMAGGNILMANNRASVLGTPGAITAGSGTITINGIGPISVGAGQTPSSIATIINTFGGIISDGTITADAVGSPTALRIFKLGGADLILTQNTGSTFSEMGISPGTYSPIGRVDGRDVSADGAVLDAMNPTGLFGFLVRTADGSPSTYAIRTINASASPARLGLEIIESAGTTGNTTIGLNVTGMTATTSLLTADEFPVYQNSSLTNKKVTAGNLLTYMRQNMNNTALRVNSNALAITTGINHPLNFFTVNFDNDSSFNNVADTVTIPANGIYQMSVYMLLGTAAPAGRYTIGFRRNGVGEGNIAVGISDATNLVPVNVSDMFQCVAGDVFTVVLNNGTIGSSTIDSLTWSVRRVY